MLKMNIIQSVEIEPITQDYLEALLRADIQSQLPEGTEISKIEFVRKRNPERVEVEVSAKFVTSTVTQELVPAEAEPVKAAVAPAFDMPELNPVCKAKEEDIISLPEPAPVKEESDDDLVNQLIAQAEQASQAESDKEDEAPFDLAPTPTEAPKTAPTLNLNAIFSGMN